MKTLHGKFFLVVAALVLAIGALAFLLQARASRHYGLAMTQVLNESLAAHLVLQYFATSPVDPQNVPEVKAQFSQIMAINPNIELYLVDGTGRIKAFTAPAGEVRRDRIDLGPVRDFISHHFVIPILGDDPKSPDREKVFSAALVNPQNPDAGFLYVILGGTDYDAAERRIQGDQVFRGALIMLGACVTIALAAAFFALVTMTRRLRRLAAAIDTFREGRFRHPVPIRSAPNGDELDRLAHAYNLMVAHIQAQMDEIAESNALRRDLIAGVSHDLRTPLASLKGYLETLIMKDKTLSADDRLQYLDIAFRESDRTARLVEELFDLAKLEELEVRMETEPFQISELVQDVLLKFNLVALEKAVSLIGRFMPEAPLVSGNIPLIERLLDNLLENAIRHTPADGRVEVAVTVEGRYLRLEVSDTGHGISDRDMPHVFERFYRGDEAGHSNSGGAGLGLAIAKRIVELHAGRISVRSDFGAGASFLVELPLL